jgi:aspartyl-tRNA(Asn)/glutamyl-tRNA(Gln) amidotransferase subunit A
LRACAADEFSLAASEEAVQMCYMRAIRALSDAGVAFGQIRATAFAEIGAINARGSFASAEAWSRFGARITAQPDAIDRRIAERVERGGTISAADLKTNLLTRQKLVRSFDQLLSSYDVLIMPTVPITAPPIVAMENDAEFRRVNALLLRNTSVANLLDRPALSLPLHPAGGPPVGLMLIGQPMADRELLAIGALMESCLRAH